MADTPRDSDRPDAGPDEIVVTDRLEHVRVRRVPKFSVFLLFGAGLGLITALVLTYVYDGTANQSPNTGLVYTQGQVFGFLALICVAVGLAVFGVLALVLDRVLSTHTREVVVDRETVHHTPAA